MTAIYTKFLKKKIPDTNRIRNSKMKIKKEQTNSTQLLNHIFVSIDHFNQIDICKFNGFP